MWVSIRIRSFGGYIIHPLIRSKTIFSRGGSTLFFYWGHRVGRNKGLSSTGAGVPLQGPLIPLKCSLSWCWNLVGPNHAYWGWTPELHTWLFLPRFDTRNFSLPQTQICEWMNETKINVSNSESAKFSLPDYEFEFCPNVYWWDTSLHHLRKNV